MKKEFCNHKEHELWNRRSFLQALGLSGMSSMVLANTKIGFATNTQLATAVSAVENDNILLVIKLFGGNDGLNMIVPLAQYGVYADARPTIKVPENKVFKLNDKYGLPDVMSSLEPMWKEDKFKVIHSVGYENQSKSHFKGTDLWASAEIESDILDTGWLGRYYDNALEDYVVNPPAAPVAIEIGSTRNITFDGEEHKYSYSVANISTLENIAKTGRVYALDNIPNCEYGDTVSFLRSTYNSSFTYAKKIQEAYNKSSDYTGGVGGYPGSNSTVGDLGESLNLIARLIKGNLGTKIYMVTLGGFDTHASQYTIHQDLLKNLAACATYFHEDLTQAGWGDKIVTMAQSEFGRRVEENGSKGTDHGTAGPVLLFGEALDGSGFVGAHSDLSNLDRGNLRHTTDFRQIYASLLKNWMCIAPDIVDTYVLGSEFEALNLGFQCASLSTNEIGGATKGFDVFTSFEGYDTIITINSHRTQHVAITLYDLHGRQISVLENSMVFEGKKMININQKLPGLTSGIYIFRLASNNNMVSKKVLVH